MVIEGTGMRRGWVVLIALAAAILWGVWWAPLRALEAVGFSGAWAGLAMSLGALPALAAAALVQNRAATPDPAPSAAGPSAAGPSATGGGAVRLIGALLIGLAITLYAASLAFTDVVRAALLFYLAPTWSVLIECSFFGRRFTVRSALAIGLSLLGALAIFRGDVALGGWSIGDAMAFGSGLAWSMGAAIVFALGAGATSARRPAALSLWTGGAAAITGAVVVVAAPDSALTIAAADAPRATLLALAAGMLYSAPILFVTLWAATKLPPATVSFILTAEIVSGVGSAALFLTEPFGVWEALGAALILAAALIEVATGQTPGATAADAPCAAARNRAS